MADLRKELIRLAHANPELQPKLLPLLEKTAASEMPLKDLPTNFLQLARKLGRPDGAWDGVHGIVVTYPRDPMGLRFGQEKLKLLANHPLVRWVSFEQGHMSLGLVHPK